MAIIWADFPSGQHGLYDTASAHMLNGIWAELNVALGTGAIGLVPDPDPNIGAAGVVLRMSPGNGGDVHARIVNPSGAHATAGIGFRLWLSRLPLGNASGNTRWYFRTSSNVTIAYCQVQTDGSIAAYSGAGLLLDQSAPILTANAYHHIETKLVRHASEGTLEVRVNGLAVLTLTELALGANDVGMVALGARIRANGDDPTNYFKDFVYWDGTGTAGNDFQGSVAVHDLVPNGDISLNWTPSTGLTGYNLLDEEPPNDLDYIQAGDPAPSPAVFSLTDLPEDVTSVRALLPIVRAVKTDGGDCNLQVSVTPNNTDWDDGADRPMTTAFTYWWDVSPTSPATSAAWTPSEVNAAYVKANRTL